MKTKRLWTRVATHLTLVAGLRAVVTGGLFAATAVVFIATLTRFDTLVWSALLAALGAGVSLASTNRRGGRVLSWETASVSTLFAGAVLVTVARRDLELLVVFLVPILAVLCAGLLRILFTVDVGHRLPDLTVQYLGRAGISVSLLSASTFGLWLSQQKGRAYITGGFLLTVVGAILGGVFLPFFKADFEDLMRVEGDSSKRQRQGRPSREQNRLVGFVWGGLVGYAVSAFASMLVLTFALAPSLRWKAGQGDIPLTQLVVGGDDAREPRRVRLRSDPPR